MSQLTTIKRLLWPRPPVESDSDAEGPLTREPVRGGPNESLRRVGRGVLWVVLALILFRGIGAIVRGSDQPSSQGAVRQSTTATWPDSQATAYAVRFATAYLTYDPKTPDFWTQTVEPFLSGRVDAAAALELPQRGPAQTAEQAVVSGTRTIARDRALVTVAVRVVGRRVGTRYLAVPVGRDRAGALAVYDYPAFVAGPARPADVLTPPPDQPLEEDRGAITALVERFVPAYLEGRDLGYLLADRARIRPLAAPLRFEKLVGVSQVEGAPSTSRRRTVVATVRAVDVATDATLTLRYRLELSRGDRWVVQQVAG